MTKLWNALKLIGGVLGIFTGAIVACWVAVSPWHVKWGALDEDAASANSDSTPRLLSVVHRVCGCGKLTSYGSFFQPRARPQCAGHRPQVVQP